MRVLAFALVLSTLPVAARAGGPSVFIFDVLHRPTYLAAYVHMVRSAPGIPRWATPAAAMMATATPGVTIMIDGAEHEVFQFCEPHNCGGHHLAVSFDRFGQRAVGMLNIEGKVKLFGDPTVDETKTLAAQMEN